MMRAALSCVLGLAVVCVLAAADEKEKTLKGNITCAKCELQKETKCTTVIVVKEDGKDVVYYVDAKTHKDHHSKICKEGKEGTITGKVEEKDGKKVVTATKVEFKK